MSRLVLVHWNADEAGARAGVLRRAGHDVSCVTDPNAGGIRGTRARPPELYVIDLARLPAQGRAVAVWLRQQKPTRAIPIVFIEGDPEKTKLTREMLPDAVFTDRRRVRGAVRRALASAPAAPVVPGTMAGYAGTPLPKKLGIKPGATVALLGAPRGFEHTLGKLPNEVRLRRRASGRAGVVLLFAGSRRDLDRRFPGAARTLADKGRLWILWPKRTSGVTTDLTQVVVRAHGMDRGFVDYKIAAVDATWSGLCFARREA